MDLKVSPELEAKLDRLAAATGRRPDQLALDLLATSVDHDDWFREEVEKVGSRLGPAGNWTMTKSYPGSTRNRAADARSMDHRCGRRSRADL